MWSQKGHEERTDDGQVLAAVAIDKDKGSQHALKWAVENLVNRGQSLMLIHVTNKLLSHSVPDGREDAVAAHWHQLEAHTKEMFLPFRCFCTRKDIHCQVVVLEGADIAKAINEYVSHHAIENLVLGASTKAGFVRRFKTVDIPTNVCKGAPDFCTVYVISKGKIASVRSSVRPAPTRSVTNMCCIKGQNEDNWKWFWRGCNKLWK